MTIRNFPLNCWYVAATSDEVGREAIGRRLLGQRVVLYRQESGAVAALEDRCAHRAYPLSAGRVDGDRIVCGYHGFEYDPDGRCVHVPSQPNVPQGVCVRRFPVHEVPPFVWIWTGDAGASTLRPPPRLPWLQSPEWATSEESFRVEANYLLLHEHYLDLTHLFVMHPEAVPPDLEELPPLDEVEVSEMSVSYSRVLPPVRLAEWEAEATGLSRDERYVRREQGTFVSPALHVGLYTIDAPDRPYEHYRIQAFTPETDDATHVFLQVARTYATDRSMVTDHLRAMFHVMALEDKALLEVVQAQRALDSGLATRDVNVTADRAAVKARRVAQAMVAEEAGRAPVRPQFARVAGA
jgi:phenylpropionate dioxygenase-like ring-hydroxylating dioxygenase large terminal subunit